MKDTAQIQSLLPYLEPAGAKLFLKFSLISEDPALLNRSRFPFRVISDSDPLYQLIDAEVSTDADSTIKKVFVLIQRDRYLLSKNEVFPITNKDVDTFWQSTFKIFEDKNKLNSHIILGNQVSKEHNLLPFQSIFFCKTKQSFFQPPCPKCGLTLQQCYDDDLLALNELQLYSASLKRYLYCPICLESGGHTDFYAYEAGSSDPPTVKSCIDLITDFAQLLEHTDQTKQLPCLECPKIKECYGSEKLVLSRIVPFSFYPFYMFIFDAMSLHVSDFLSLVSGASFEDLEAHLNGMGEWGRAACLHGLKRDAPFQPSFLFSDDRNFLEVLYLKLSFLAELATMTCSASITDQWPHLGLSIDQLWVNLATAGSLLPPYWAFKVNPIGLVTKPLGMPAFPKPPASYGLYLLSLSWFQVLVVNRHQNPPQVYRSIGALFEQTPADQSTPFAEEMPKDVSAIFAPENIFWEPSGKNVNINYEGLWAKGLTLGWSLLRASYDLEKDWATDLFLQRLDNYRENVKGNLFQASPVSTAAVDDQSDKTINEILVRITEKWKAAIEGEPAEVSAPDIPPAGIAGEEKITPDIQVGEAGEEVIPATIMLSSEELSKMSAPPSETEPPPHQEKTVSPEPTLKKDEEEDIPKTMILSPDQAADVTAKTTAEPKTPGVRAKPPEPPPSEVTKDLRLDPQAEDEEEDIPKTVILSPDQAADVTAKTTAEPKTPGVAAKPAEPPPSEVTQELRLDSQAEEEDIPKTVILTPTDMSRQPGAPTPELPADEVAVEGNAEEVRKKKAKEVPEDDFSVETVFLSLDDLQENGKEDTDE